MLQKLREQYPTSKDYKSDYNFNDWKTGNLCHSAMLKLSYLFQGEKYE